MEWWIERSGVAKRVIVLMSGTVGRRRERKGYEPSWKLTAACLNTEICKCVSA